MRHFHRGRRTAPATSHNPLRVEQLEDRTTPAVIPPGFSETVFASGLNVPTAMALAPDGRIFVAEKGGALRVVQNGNTLATPFLSVSVNTVSERGLVGVALDPNFAANGFVYVYYTASGTTPVNRVSRFTASAANPNVAQPMSEQILINNIPSTNGNHNGGALVFGNDGMLYIGVGEAGVQANSQDLSNVLGKVLRIEPDGDIPPDNPFVSTPGARDEIWAFGLRNPFTMAIQPGSGTLAINDVGGALFEEVNVGIRGANYGWPNAEGNSSNPAFVNPIYAYAHGAGPLQGNSIAGGAFYNPASASFPGQYVGDYFFGEFVRSRIFVRDAATGAVTTFADPTAGGGVVDLDVLPDGRLLYLSLSTGSIYQIAAVPPVPPVPQLIAVGTGPGIQSFVAGLNPNGTTRFVTPVLPGFGGGVRVATGDITGDGFEDIVATLGPGGLPVVAVYNGTTGQLATVFFALTPGYTGGLSVAVGDVTGDGRADIIVGTTTGMSAVGVFDGVTFAPVRAFFAAPGFTNGVNVAAGDLDGDGRAEIVVGIASSLSAVGVFSGATGAPMTAFFAFGAAPVGVNVAVAGGEIVVGAATGLPFVATFNTAGQPRLVFAALPPGVSNGIRVAVQGDQILTVGGPYLAAYTRSSGALAFAQFAFGASVPGEVFVG